MTYEIALKPWCIVQMSLTGNQVIARFRRRTDAECRAKVLQRLTASEFLVMFQQEE